MPREEGTAKWGVTKKQGHHERKGLRCPKKGSINLRRKGPIKGGREKMEPLRRKNSLKLGSDASNETWDPTIRSARRKKRNKRV